MPKLDGKYGLQHIRWIVAASPIRLRQSWDFLASFGRRKSQNGDRASFGGAKDTGEL